LGAPCSAPNQGCAERQWGTAIFSLGSLALSRVLGFVSCPWLRLVSLALPRFRRRCAALPDPLFPATRASRPGLHAAAAGAAGLRNRTIRSSDPMDRAVSVGRVRRTRPTVESKAASSRRTPGRGPRPARAIQSPPSSIEAEKMTPRAAVCGRVAGSSDPILRSHGSCGFRGPRPADAAYGSADVSANPRPAPRHRSRAERWGREPSLEPRSRLRISITITNYEHELRARQASYS